MVVLEPKKRLILKLEEDEIKYLREWTQNYLGDGEESLKDKQIRKQLFVHCSRALGYEISDDGFIKRELL